MAARRGNTPMGKGHLSYDFRCAGGTAEGDWYGYRYHGAEEDSGDDDPERKDDLRGRHRGGRGP